MSGSRRTHHLGVGDVGERQREVGLLRGSIFLFGASSNLVGDWSRGHDHHGLD